MKSWVRILILCIAVAGLFGWLLSSLPLRTPKSVAEISDYQPWDKEVVKAAEGVAVHDDGRVKPLLSYARFHLMGLSGKSKVQFTISGKAQTLTPTEWLLDCLFRPRVAAKLKVFSIDDTEVLEGIGMSVDDKSRRDLFSYEELSAHHDKITERGVAAQQALERANSLPDDEKARFRQDVALYRKMSSFEKVAGSLAFSSQQIPFAGNIFNEAPDKVRLMSFYDSLQVSYGFIGAYEKSLQEQKPVDPAIEQVAKMMRALEGFARQGLPILAPLKNKEAKWDTYGELIAALNNGEGRLSNGELSEDGIAIMDDLKEVCELASAFQKDGTGGEFKAKFVAWTMMRQSEANQIPSARFLGWELAYYRAKYLHNGLGFFLLGFLIAALGWLSPKSKFGKVMSWAALGSFLLGTLTITAAVVHRSIIMQRPPVGNLYDTIPFIIATAGLILIVVEFLGKRRGLATAIGLVFCSGLCFLAIRYEAGVGEDTMDPLVAVLDSSYWLTTHVICVVLGYMASLLAAAISHVFLLGRVFGLDGGDKELRRTLTRMCYGVIGFALLFSTVGTLLGGVWANDSWGRFWGWDPKENGALMIVLMNLIILHARVGGMIREFGLHILSVFGGIVVAFSWWGVNMLEVGLHSYGFTAGADALNYFYGIEFGFIALCLMSYWLFHSDSAKKKQLSTAE